MTWFAPVTRQDHGAHSLYGQTAGAGTRAKYERVGRAESHAHLDVGGRVSIKVNPSEIEWSAIRAQGPGGQNVNKVSDALQLRFDIRGSSLPHAVKERLLAQSDQRITRNGFVIIKAQRYRSQDRNRTDALARLQALVDSAAAVPRPRLETRPTRGSKRRRVDSKVQRGQIKAARRKIVD